MALIRSTNASTITRDAIVLDLGDLREQGERLVASARAEAERIVAAAHAERARIVQGAAEKGHADGLSKGLEEGRKQGREQAGQGALAEHRAKLDALEQAWIATLTDFASRRDDLVQGALRDVVRLSITIAERVVKRSISQNPGIVQDQLAAVLAVVVRPTELVVRTNPEDRPLLAGALPSLLAAMPAIRHVEFVDDSSVRRGGCIATTRADLAAGDAGGAEIDATIGTQLDRLVEALLPGDTNAAGESAPEGTPA